MPTRLIRRFGESSASVQQQLPFTSDTIEDSDFTQDQPAQARLAPARSPPSTSGSVLSSSFTQRTPARSFFHQASHASSDTPQYSSQGVREKTQELASYALDADSFHGARSYTDSDCTSTQRTSHLSQDTDRSEGRLSFDSTGPGVIEEVSEPASPEIASPETYRGRPSPFIPPSQQPDLGNDVYNSSGRRWGDIVRTAGRAGVPEVAVEDVDMPENSENAPLLPRTRPSMSSSKHPYSVAGQSWSERLSPLGIRARFRKTLSAGHNCVRTATNPKNYTKKAVFHNATAGVQLLSAVFLGLLLNVLDGLSYAGLILFPLGDEIFAKTGPDGISIFFVSCIVSQLCYSLGLSIFRGGVGSEMIEVVPFFHKMAYSIMHRMAGESPQAIMATVIVAYCLSSIVTGLIFLALGLFKLGNLVSFFPRSILTGCIGGVGFFLVVTGVEVSARIDGNLEYNYATLQKLFDRNTVMLWMLPLMLSILILLLRRFVKSPFVLPGFFLTVTAAFYIVAKGILKRDLEDVRNAGWIFERPDSGVPFYHFYSYFNFRLIDGAALASTIPSMFALSFFGIIHVPINVPALGVAVKEDNVNVNRELIAHGISNTLSGCLGSIQNYLVYANSILFIDNGGDSRTAGILLAIATTAVWMAGPAMIGFIPVCMVGALIFMLGFELLQEAVWDPLGKLHKLEYLTIIAIVLIMGVYDFVAGIVVGIVLACLNYVVQTSRTPAIRASYSGEVAESTVRRPRADRRYLHQVRRQIWVQKLSGYLFFGTIVAVEGGVRALIQDEAFRKQPISFIIVDFSHVTGLDFSAAEGFQRINRILCRKNVRLLLSGVSFANPVGKSLDMVGLLDTEKGDVECPPPGVFEDLNTALEWCENELLDAFYKHRSRLGRKKTPPMSISTGMGPRDSTPQNSFGSSLKPDPFNELSIDPAFQTPRREAQMQAAAKTLHEQGDTAVNENDTIIPSKWKHFAQPTKIMLQTFEDVSTRNEDFWHRAAPYFQRREYAAGTVLYSRGDEPDGFYILEQGRFRAEYDLEQGNYYEVILPGTTCGELPFFSETDRTGTVAAENDSVAWLLTREKFKELEARQPDVASELLKVGLRLTSERMNAITS
ncbi:hypothetical protein AOQ84DRAFT_417879 [Glonium stellatum]|uniref:Sulfate transporter n=1 Tax=Glonium stellatum TaxID=574774 RepID=A0A8E2ES80_9PEZI|nr:hypothetical protein AOQ84DRAFT_417879 [Glonium stellatum]